MPTLEERLRRALSAGIQDGCKIRDAKTHEPDVVAGLFRTSVDLLQKELTNALQPLGLEVRVGGVYCHQSPYLTHPGGRCELGDLLVVCRYEREHEAVNNALLLQAKMTRDLSVDKMERRWRRLEARADKQYLLYRDWPRFTWEIGGAVRRAQPPTPHAGAQYAFIEVCGHGCPQCEIAVAVPKGAPRGLAAELVDVLFRASGRPFANYAIVRRRRNWDRIVWDVLRANVAAADYALRAAGSARWSRRRGIEGVFFARSTVEPPFYFEAAGLGLLGRHVATAWREGMLPVPDDFQPPDEVEEGRASVAGEPPRGVSTLAIEIRERQDVEQEPPTPRLGPR